MLDEKTKALLGDREALTDFWDKRELLPCHCGRKVAFDTIRLSGNPGVCCILKCGCGITLSVFAQNENDAVMQLIRVWNNRAPIITPEQIDTLDRKKCCRTCEFSNGNEYGPDEPVDHLNCSFNDMGDIWVKPDDYCSYGYKERL